MKSPKVGKQRSSVLSSLSSRLPKLKLPLGAATQTAARPHPRVGKAGGATSVRPRDGRK